MYTYDFFSAICKYCAINMTIHFCHAIKKGYSYSKSIHILLIHFLQDPERFNCRSLRSSNNYSFKNPDGIWQNTGNNYITVFSEGNVQIHVELTATNNENFVSLATYATYTTLPLRE